MIVRFPEVQQQMIFQNDGLIIVGLINLINILIEKDEQLGGIVKNLEVQ